MTTSNTPSSSGSKGIFWAGVVVSALPALVLLASGVAKLAASPKPEDLAPIGWTVDKMLPLAIVELVCVILYLIPRTAVLGAILITGYMGGAIAAHVRINDYFVVQALIGVLTWLGLYLRDARVRQLIPLRA